MIVSPRHWAPATVLVLAMPLLSCASVLDRAQQAWDRGEPDRAEMLLERSQEGLALEKWPLEAVLLRLELDLVHDGESVSLAPFVERLDAASGPETEGAAARRLAAVLLDVAEQRNDRQSWASAARTLPASEAPPLRWLPGLLVLVEQDHHLGAAALSAAMAALDADEQERALARVDLWLYQLRPQQPWPSYRSMLLALQTEALTDAFRAVLLRHELFGILERNRTPREDLLVEIRESTGQWPSQLAAEAGLRGLHRSARALWVEAARDAPPATAVPALRRAAESAYLQGDVRGARRLLDESVLLEPRSMDALLEAVHAAMALGDQAFAELLLDRATVGAGCDILVRLALPRLRLRVGRADDEGAVSELEETAAHCSAPELLGEGAVFLASHTSSPAALDLLESRLEAGSRDEDVIRAWARVSPPGEGAEARLLHLLEGRPVSEAIALVAELEEDNEELIGPILHVLVEARWRENPADGALLRAFLERRAWLGDSGADALRATIGDFIAAGPDEMALVEMSETLLVPARSSAHARESIRAVLAELATREPLPELLAFRVLAVTVAAAILDEDVDRAVALLVRQGPEQRRVPLDRDLLEGTSSGERIALIDAGVSVDGSPSLTEVTLAASLLESGRIDRASALWRSMAERSPSSVVEAMEALSREAPGLAAHLGAMLQGVDGLPDDHVEARTLLFLRQAYASDGLSRVAWLGRARRDALDLLAEGSVLGRESIELLRSLGQPDLSSWALRNEMLSSSRTRRSTVLQWVEDRLAEGDSEEDLRSIVLEALADATSIERAEAAQRLGAAGAVALAADLRDQDSAPPPLEDPSPDQVEREVGFLTSRGETERAMALIGALLLDPALALVEPAPFDDPPGMADAARAVRLARDAAEHYGALGRTDRAVEAWTVVLRYAPPGEKSEELVAALETLTRPTRATMTADMLEALVGASGGSPSAWSRASAELEEVGELELALHATVRAMALRTRDHGLRQRAARLHAGLGQTEQSVVAWEHAFDLAPADELESVLLDLHAHTTVPLEQHSAFPTFADRARSGGDSALTALVDALESGDEVSAISGAPFVVLLMLGRHTEGHAGWMNAIPTLGDREATMLLRTWGRELREGVDAERWARLLEAHLEAGVARQTAERQLALVRARQGDLEEAAGLLGDAEGSAAAARIGWLLRSGTVVPRDEQLALLRNTDLLHAAPALLGGGTIDAFQQALMEASALPAGRPDLLVAERRVALARTQAEDVPGVLEDHWRATAPSSEDELGEWLSGILALHGTAVIEPVLMVLPSALPGPTESDRVRMAFGARANNDDGSLAVSIAAHRHSAGELLEVDLRLAEILMDAGLPDPAQEVIEAAWERHGHRSRPGILVQALPIAHVLGPEAVEVWVTRSRDLPSDETLLPVVDALVLIGRLDDAESMLDRASSNLPSSTAVLARQLMLGAERGQSITPRMGRQARWLLDAEPLPPLVRTRLSAMADAGSSVGEGAGFWRMCLDEADGGDAVEVARRCALNPPEGGGVFDGVAHVLDALAMEARSEHGISVAREAFPAAFELPGLAGDGIRAPWLLLEGGLAEEARVVAARALVLDPECWRAHQAMSAALAALGDRRMARWHALRSARQGGLLTMR